MSMRGAPLKKGGKGKKDNIKVTCVFSLAKALKKRQSSNWSRGDREVRFVILPLQSMKDHMHTIGTIDIGRHK